MKHQDLNKQDCRRVGHKTTACHTSVTKRENPDQWHENEIKSHIKNETWILVYDKAKNKIGCKLVLKNKLNSDSSLQRKKARLGACGFAQRPNVDFVKTFAPVAKLKSIRLLLGLAAKENLKVSQLDVTTAYLNGDIEEQICMEKPTCTNSA
ncbi:hypothetical protein Trydic_g8741 [Trypoxylus dichotomus]